MRPGILRALNKQTRSSSILHQLPDPPYPNPLHSHIIVGVFRLLIQIEFLLRDLGFPLVGLQLGQQALPLQRQERHVQEPVKQLQPEAVPHGGLGVAHLGSAGWPVGRGTGFKIGERGLKGSGGTVGADGFNKGKITRRHGGQKARLTIGFILFCSIRTSVRKLFSRFKFTEQIFTPQTEQNFQLRTQIILLLRVAEQFM